MTFEEIMLIAAMGSVGALWAFIVAGALHVAWDTAFKPILRCIKKRR